MAHPYCSQNGSSDGDLMPAKLSLVQLTQLTCDTGDGDDIDQTIIDAAIEAADVLIDGYCASKYSVPFATIPPLVRDASIKLSVFNLFENRSAAVGMPESIQKMRDDVVKMLKDISAGTASLGVDPPPAGNTLTTAKVVGNPRMFSKDTMRAF
jgi:phage gp36-like protein